MMLVAIDDGYAQMKLYGDALVPGEPPLKFMTGTAIRQGRFGVASVSGSGMMGSYRTEEGEDYTVSESIESENTQFPTFHVSQMNRVLVTHTLLEAGYNGQAIDLVAGLPLGDFFDDEGGINQENIDRKKANLLKGVSDRVHGKSVTINSVNIGCQALAAFVDYWLDDELKPRDVPSERVAVVDIGGGTTDIAVIINGNSFDAKRSGTHKFGALNVYSSLMRGVNKHFDTSDKYPLSVLSQAVRTNRIRLWGKEHDITDLVKEALLEQQEQIKRNIERMLGKASDIDAVLFVGGGAALFKDISSMFPNGVAIEDPEFANARGMHKYRRYFAQ